MTKKLKRGAAVRSSDLVRPRELTMDEVMRCRAAADAGNMNEARRIVESAGLKWLEGESVKTSVIEECFPHSMIPPRNQQTRENHASQPILYRRASHPMVCHLESKDCEQESSQSSCPQLDESQMRNGRDSSCDSRSNAPAHRRRADDVRLSTETRSRRSVQPACWACSSACVPSQSRSSHFLWGSACPDALKVTSG